MDYDRRMPLGVIDALTLIYANDSGPILSWMVKISQGKNTH